MSVLGLCNNVSFLETWARRRLFMTLCGNHLWAIWSWSCPLRSLSALGLDSKRNVKVMLRHAGFGRIMSRTPPLTITSRRPWSWWQRSIPPHHPALPTLRAALCISFDDISWYLISYHFQNIVKISLSHFFWKYHTIFYHVLLVYFSLSWTCESWMTI